MTTRTDIRQNIGSTVVDASGQKVGTVDQIYFDKETQQPEWALVDTGFLGLKRNFVPLAGAEMRDGTVMVPYPADKVKSAPNIEAGGEISREDEEKLARFYGLSYSTAPSGTGLEQSGKGGEPTGQAGRKSGISGTDVQRSEEELKVGVARRPSELVRVHKDVVTEHVQQTVPVKHEELRVERMPADAKAGEIAEGEQTIELMHEEPVVEKRPVAKERVHLGKETKTEQKQVEGDVRKERLDIDRERR